MPGRRTMAGYQSVATGFTDADYRVNRGALFGSVPGTLNQLLVADRIWMHRVTGDGPTHSARDTVRHGAPPDLRADREREDEQIHPRAHWAPAQPLRNTRSPGNAFPSRSCPQRAPGILETVGETG